jgi:phospholipid/cholesterol/gamma-HCH transport system substrate-binding protein
MNKNIIETVVGFIVIAIAVGFIIIAYQSGSIDARKLDGYNILAQFDRADGIGIGADVRLSGLKIGSVTKMIINPKNYDAEVTLKIDKKL